MESVKREPETALYSGLARSPTRAPARRLVQPSCTVLPLAAGALFTRRPTNQRGRRGAWTQCAASWAAAAVRVHGRARRRAGLGAALPEPWGPRP